jgi:hypothetical protein
MRGETIPAEWGDMRCTMHALYICTQQQQQPSTPFFDFFLRLYPLFRTPLCSLGSPLSTPYIKNNW